MVLEVARSGGLGDMRREVLVDTSDLEPHVRDRLEDLVARIDVQAMESGTDPEDQRPDRFTYDVVLTRAGRRYQFTCQEGRCGPEVDELMDLLFRGFDA